MASDPFALLNVVCVSSVFGTEISYSPSSGSDFTVRGIFDRITDEEQHVDGVSRKLFLKLADCPVQPDHGDTLTVGARNYRVHEVLVDEGGGVQLTLREY
jgi:hypothetical protein